MPKITVTPELQNSSLFDSTEIIWQQNNPPLHYTNVVQKLLYATFVE